VRIDTVWYSDTYWKYLMNFYGNINGFRKRQDAEGLSRVVSPEVQQNTPQLWHSHLQYIGMFKHMTFNNLLTFFQKLKSNQLLTRSSIKYVITHCC
jgi:hypothetical protein